METHEDTEDEEGREINQQLSERVIRKARKPAMIQRKEKDPSDEVRGSDSKPPEEEEELSGWEEEDEIPHTQ